MDGSRVNSLCAFRGEFRKIILTCSVAIGILSEGRAGEISLAFTAIHTVVKLEWESINYTNLSYATLEGNSDGNSVHLILLVVNNELSCEKKSYCPRKGA